MEVLTPQGRQEQAHTAGGEAVSMSTSACAASSAAALACRAAVVALWQLLLALRLGALAAGALSPFFAALLWCLARPSYYWCALIAPGAASTSPGRLKDARDTAWRQRCVVYSHCGACPASAGSMKLTEAR